MAGERYMREERENVRFFFCFLLCILDGERERVKKIFFLWPTGEEMPGEKKNCVRERGGERERENYLCFG